MTLKPEDIRALVSEFNDSDWQEMSLTVGDTSLVLSRRGHSQLAPQAPPVPAPAVHESEAQVPAAPAPEQVETATPPEGRVIESPTIGLFWRSPQPGAAPFVEIGDTVEADDTLCIVEVMKLMNHIKAGVAGVVVAITPDNGAMVEHGDALVTIAPAG